MTDTASEPNYQDILDKYADSIKSTELPPTLKPEPELESVPTPESLLDTELTPESKLEINSEPEIETPINPQPEPEIKVQPQPEIETDPQPEIEAQPQPELASEPLNLTTPPAPESITTPAPPEELTPESSDLLPPKENHFFKYLFFFSLFIFLVVLVSVIFSFINSQKSLSNTQNTPTNVSPTVAPAGVCEVNGQTYAVGESFPATDGCNSCSCDETLQIACTAMACEATTSATSKDWKSHIIPGEKLSIKYPQNWLLTSSTSGETIYTLTSPNKLNLAIRVGIDGLGGGCDEVCQSHNIENIIIGTLDFYTQPLNIVVHGIKDDSEYGKANISFNVIPEKSCWDNVCYGFKGKNSLGTVIINGSYSKYMSSDEFVNSVDVKTAISILKTLSY